MKNRYFTCTLLPGRRSWQKKDQRTRRPARYSRSILLSALPLKHMPAYLFGTPAPRTLVRRLRLTHYSRRRSNICHYGRSETGQVARVRAFGRNDSCPKFHKAPVPLERFVVREDGRICFYEISSTCHVCRPRFGTPFLETGYFFFPCLLGPHFHWNGKR